jgi:hypothetical protein
VLEYYRTPGFTYQPTPPPTPTLSEATEPVDDERSLGRLVCADGAIFMCPSGGHVEVAVLGPTDAGRNGVGEVWVWV